MKQQETPKQEITMSETTKGIQWASMVVALNVNVLTRHDIGLRRLKPAYLIGAAAFMMLVASLFSGFGHGLGILFSEYPLIVLTAGFFQRNRRWKELCDGKVLHTYAPGVSYLEKLPLPLWAKDQRRIYRFVEPALLFVFAMCVGVLLSEPLARWIAFSAVCSFIHEQNIYERQLDRDLDVLDSIVAAQVHEETVTHFTGGHPEDQMQSVEETAGIPTGVSHELRRLIEIRRARQQRTPASDSNAESGSVV
jgi:hypothetical protein